MYKLINNFIDFQKNIFYDNKNIDEKSSKKTNIKIFIFLTFLIGLMVLKTPSFFLYGRIWAEEGPYYISAIYKRGALINSLFYVFDVAGYYHLVANLTTIFGLAFLPIELLSYFFVFIAIIISVYLYILILKTSSYINDSFNSKLMFCILLVLSPVVNYEVWLNILHAPTMFCIISIIILTTNYFKYNTKIAKSTHIALLIAGLTGLYSCVLSPLFICKSLYTKKKEDILNSFIICICTIIQLIIVIYTKIKGTQASSRFSSKFTKIILDIFKNNILGNLLGTDKINFVTNLFDKYKQTIIINLFIIILLIFTIAMINYLIKCKYYKLLYLSIIFIMISAFTGIGSLGGQISNRYCVVPGVTILMSLLYIEKNALKDRIKYLSRILLILCIICGILTSMNSTVYNILNIYPKWSQEIKIWKNNPKYKVAIAPAKWDFNIGNPKYATKEVIYENKIIKENTGEILKGSSIKQNIYFDTSMLKNPYLKIELFIATFARDNKSILSVEIKQDNYSEIKYVDCKYLNDNYYLGIYLDTNKFSLGDAEIIISSKDAQLGDGIAIYLSDDRDFKDVNINGKELPKNLRMRFSY